VQIRFRLMALVGHYFKTQEGFTPLVIPCINPGVIMTKHTKLKYRPLDVISADLDMKFVADRSGNYHVQGVLSVSDILGMAQRLAAAIHASESLHLLTSPDLVRSYLHSLLLGVEHEVFGVLLLDNQNRICHEEVLFRGTIDGAAVYPREVVKLALQHNAAAVLFYHNHPSGVSEPSRADRHITDKLKSSLDLIDVRVLDHLVMGKGESVSFAERGWI
jgi:DNA repair protein RadC